MISMDLMRTIISGHQGSKWLNVGFKSWIPSLTEKNTRLHEYESPFCEIQKYNHYDLLFVKGQKETSRGF